MVEECVQDHGCRAKGQSSPAGVHQSGQSSPTSAWMVPVHGQAASACRGVRAGVRDDGERLSRDREGMRREAMSQRARSSVEVPLPVASMAATILAGPHRQNRRGAAAVRCDRRFAFAGVGQAGFPTAWVSAVRRLKSEKTRSCL
jgi:hypothetical protein